MGALGFQVEPKIPVLLDFRRRVPDVGFFFFWGGGTQTPPLFFNNFLAAASPYIVKPFFFTKPLYMR
jgi:hypothetical protein